MKSLTPLQAVEIGLAVVGLLTVLLFLVNLSLGRQLTRAGYVLQATPPFAVKPAPPPPPRPPDLAHLGYAAPVLLSVSPVRGDTLTLNAPAGTLTVFTFAGNVLVLSRDGRTIIKYALPLRHLRSTAPPRPTPPAAPAQAGAVVPAPTPPAAPAQAGAVVPAPTPAAPPPQRLHAAVDPQGDLYIADSALRSIEKYSPRGEFLRYVAQGRLTKPEALAVDNDGTVYVIDAERLKAIHAQPEAGR